MIQRIAMACAAAAWLGACAPPPGDAGPGVVRRPAAVYRFYEVTGTDAAGILTSMRAGAPRAGDRPAYGRTEWTIVWRARWEFRGGACRVTDAVVRHEAVVTLPEWTRPPEAGNDLAARWHSFVRALSVHEAGHVDIAAAGAREIRRALERLTAPSCTGMGARVDAEAAQRMAEYRARNRAYDERTRRGATRGAVWP